MPLPLPTHTHIHTHILLESNSNIVKYTSDWWLLFLYLTCLSDANVFENRLTAYF